jgi:hypothetical protein
MSEIKLNDMTDQMDYRLYLEGKFDALHGKLDTIVEQVKKTNGTVIELRNEDKRLEEEIDQLNSWAHHIVDVRATECPLIPRISSVESSLKANSDELFEYRFFKRYPKLTVLLITIFIFGTIISVIGTIRQFISG